MQNIIYEFSNIYRLNTNIDNKSNRNDILNINDISSINNKLNKINVAQSQIKKIIKSYIYSFS